MKLAYSISFGLVASLYLAHVVAPLEESRNDDKDTALNNATQDLPYPLDVPRTRAHLSPWNDHWYLFIGTSVRVR